MCWQHMPGYEVDLPSSNSVGLLLRQRGQLDAAIAHLTLTTLVFRGFKSHAHELISTATSSTAGFGQMEAAPARPAAAAPPGATLARARPPAALQRSLPLATSRSSSREVSKTWAFAILAWGWRASRRPKGELSLGAAERSRSGSRRIACRAAAEVQSDFVSACSMAPTWEEAVEEVAQEVGTGFEAAFVFASELYVDQAQGMAPLMETLRERLDVEHLVGGAAGGSIGRCVGKMATDYGKCEEGEPIEVERGFVLSVAAIRTAGAVPFFVAGDASGDLELINRMAEGGAVRSMLLLADPFGPVEQIMQTLDESFPKVTKAGGITAALRVGSGTQVGFMPSMSICSRGNQARLLSQGICGLMMTDMDVRISNVSGPVVLGIGGRPAKEALGLIFGNVDETLREKMRSSLLLGLGSPGVNENSIDDGDWLIRGIQEVTPNGGFVVGGALEEGQALRFHVRDKESAEADLKLMLNRYRLERSFSGGQEPLGCLLFTCNGRGENLYGRRHVDARALQEALGDLGSRVTGFFCNGELGAPGLTKPSEELASRDEVRPMSLHGFTAVFAILVPAKS
ncbi:unnamed protein product [Durusdinium trenchii]|uniref:FIST C-domain domain-containing protein n=1 Tax=Durusdinium trenchii TaxID=1381693 RepID=A0ABP0R7X4_9DINO